MKKIVSMYKDLFYLYGIKNLRKIVKLIIVFLLLGVTAYISPMINGIVVSNIQKNYIEYYISIIVLIDILLPIAINLLVKYYSNTVNNQVKNELRYEIFKKIYNYKSDDISKGELLARVTMDTSIILNIGTMMISFLSNIVIALISAIGILVINPILFVICLFFALIIIYINNYLNSGIGDLSQKKHQYQSRYNELIDNMISAYEEIKFEDIKNIIFGRVDDLINESKRNEIKYDIKIDLPGRILDFILGVSPIIGYILVFFLFENDKEILMIAVVAIGYIRGFFGKITFVAFINSLANPLMDAMDRIKEIIFLPEDKSNVYYFEKVNRITMENVSFSYDSNKKILEDISFVIDRGLLCLCGKSGSGKSTIIKLLLGYVNNYCGEIRINNMLVNQLNMSYFRKNSCCFYAQEGTLFSGTIEDNIKLYNPNYNSEYVYLVAKKLNLIEEFGKQFLKTNIVEEGRNISFGQMARIRLLAVLSKQSEVIILDEPTKSLDLKSTVCIKELLCELKEKRIIICATHDDQLVDIADQKIVLLDD